LINIANITKVIKKINRLGVCGASWACTDSRYPKTHFTELLAKHYGCEYKNYALPGCANDVICLQIQQALYDGCDGIVIQIEMPNRITLPYPDKSNNDFRLTTVKSSFDFVDHPFSGSDETKSFLSANHESLLRKQVTISDKDHINQDYKNSIRKYVTFLYSDNKQSISDSWAFSYFLKTIISEKIPFLFIIDNKNPIKQHMKYFQKYKLKGNYPFSYKDIAVLDDPVYHTDAETQIKTFQLAQDYFDKY